MGMLEYSLKSTKENGGTIMRKLLIIIGILVVIFIGMVIYNKIGVKNTNAVNIEEIQKIEEAISNIYLWKEVTRRGITGI